MNSFYNDVNEWLSVGGDTDLARDLTGQDHATTIAALRDHGVTHVLDVRSEWHDLGRWTAGGLRPENYSHTPITDRWGYQPPERWFQAVEDFVEKFWLASSEGDRLLVHCHMGINRAPSAAMLALLTINPSLDPFDAFLAIREARPAAGLVYAKPVGIRHIGRSTDDKETFGTLKRAFVKALDAYWTPEQEQAVSRGIAYFRSAEGGTIKVGGKAVIACPSGDEKHRIKWNSGNPMCLDCGSPARSVPKVDIEA